MANKNTINKRIIDIMKENWLSPLFFAAGIDVLKQKIELLSDSDICKLFGGLMSPDFVRKELERIQAILQSEQQKKITQINDKMKVEEIEIGKEYHLTGDIENGYMNGKPYVSHEEVTRAIIRITETHIICECGRKFLINENLTITVPAYRK